ncbi:hypothetical protein BDR03DRAFT_938981 [Suillus americanus]|nr:hypothetical protein BDR03DRAFT_938981 [Suillus americanus]
MKVVEAGKSTCRRHTQMRTCEEVGNLEIAQDLEASFAWAPLLLTDGDRPSCRSGEYLAQRRSHWILVRVEKEWGDSERWGAVFDFGELDRVGQGIIPKAILDEVGVVKASTFTHGQFFGAP